MPSAPRLLIPLVLVGGTAAFALTIGTVAKRPFQQIADALKPADGLDDYGPAGDFTFTEKSGRPVTQDDLKGKVWVVACFFTCCTESCPALSGSMARLQHELANEPDLCLVSLTVDPSTDTPAKLTDYAANYGALPERWLFLTGPQADVNAFVTGRLHLGVEANPGAPAGSRVMHSNKLTVIDKQGRIRGYFDGAGPDAERDVGKLKEAVARLAKEPG
jgi:protein SCO1/2